MAAAAPVHAGMTWLLSLGKNRNLIHPLAGLRKSCNFAARNTGQGLRSKLRGGNGLHDRFFLLHLNLVHAVLDMLSASHNTNGEFYYKIQIIFFLIHEVMIQ